MSHFSRKFSRRTNKKTLPLTFITLNYSHICVPSMLLFQNPSMQISGGPLALYLGTLNRHRNRQMHRTHQTRTHTRTAEGEITMKPNLMCTWFRVVVPHGARWILKNWIGPLEDPTNKRKRSRRKKKEIANSNLTCASNLFTTAERVNGNLIPCFPKTDQPINRPWCTSHTRTGCVGLCDAVKKT